MPCQESAKYCLSASGLSRIAYLFVFSSEDSNKLLYLCLKFHVKNCFFANVVSNWQNEINWNQIDRKLCQRSLARLFQKINRGLWYFIKSFNCKTFQLLNVSGLDSDARARNLMPKEKRCVQYFLTGKLVRGNYLLILIKF